jgi:DNA polymerase III alpha subunit
VKKAITKNGRSAGQQLAMLTIEDLEGQIDAVMFAETLAGTLKQYPDLVESDALIFIKGKVDTRRETPSIVVNEMFPIAEAVGKLTESVALRLEAGRHGPDLMAQIKPILLKHRGGGAGAAAAQVYIQVSMPDARKVTLRVGRDYAVKVDDTIVGELERVLGPNTVKLAGKGIQRLKMKQQTPAPQQLFEGSGPTDEDVQLSADQQLDHDMAMAE